MAKKRVAICPKCENIYTLKARQVEAWCQHVPVEKKYVDGPEEIVKEKKLPKTLGEAEVIKCVITEIQEG